MLAGDRAELPPGAEWLGEGRVPYVAYADVGAEVEDMVPVEAETKSMCLWVCSEDPDEL